MEAMKEEALATMESGRPRERILLSVRELVEFLGRNDALFRNEEKVISDGALVAITLMIAESKPEEKDIMTTLVMNLLKM